MLAEITATITDSDPNSLKADLSFSTNSGDSLATAMTIRADRFVRIGNTAASNAYAPAQGYVAGLSSPVTGGQTYLSITTGGGSLGDTGVIFGIDSDGGSWYHREDKPLRLYTQSIERMRVTGSGNVGIGTTSPGYKLSIDDSSVTSTPKTLLQLDGSNITDNGGYNIDFRTSTSDLADRYIARIQGVRESTGALSKLSFWTESGTALEERMTIRASGNVGIGTTSPTAKLDVNGVIKYGNNGSSVAALSYGSSGLVTLEASSANTSIGIIPSGTGNVGIGTTSPVAKLDVNGATRIGGKTTYTKAYASLDTTGNAVAGLGTSGNGASARLVFEIHGGAGEYQRVVYSCYNASGNWYPTKAIDEGTNAFDVTDSGNGTTVTFTFKARTASQAYTPYVTIEHVGAAIDTQYL